MESVRSLPHSECMVDLTLTEQQTRLRDDLRTAAIEQLRLPPGTGETDEIPQAARDALAGFAELPGTDGFVSGETDALAFCLAAESLAAGDPAAALAWTTSRQVAWLIARCGTETQQKEWLGRFADDALFPASLLLYEGFGRVPTETETTARRDGAGWVIDGDKIAVAHSTDAPVALVVARDESGRLVAFLSDEFRDSITFVTPASGPLALASVPLASARITGLRVSSDAILAEGDLVRELAVCRLAQAAVSVGVADGTTRYAANWGRNRIAFGKPLVGFQGYSFVLADLFMDIEAARLGIQHALGVPPDEVEALTSAVVGQINQLVGDAGREGVELMGVHGVITDHPAERFFRSAAVLSSIDFDPTSSLLTLR